MIPEINNKPLTQLSINIAMNYRVLLKVLLHSTYNSAETACPPQPEAQHNKTLRRLSTHPARYCYCKSEILLERGHSFQMISLPWNNSVIISAVVSQLNSAVFSRTNRTKEKSHQSRMHTESSARLRKWTSVCFDCSEKAIRPWIDLTAGRETIMLYILGCRQQLLSCSNGSQGWCWKMWFRTEKQKGWLQYRAQAPCF